MGNASEEDQSSLEILASSRFGPLHEAERRLLKAIPLGEHADCGPAGVNFDQPEHDPVHADKWGLDRVIRAELLRWLCLHPVARANTMPDGISLAGARLDATLRLSFAQLPFPFRAYDCWFPNGIELDQAEMPALMLSGSRIGMIQAGRPAVVADGLKVTGPVLLNGVHAEGELRLVGAEIGGPLECNGASFDNVGKVALNCERARLNSVLLRNGFTANGLVLLRGAEMRGNLECRDGFFKNANGKALDAESAKIDGIVFCDKGFRIEGGLSLRGAKMGNLQLDGADFGVGDSGLDASAATIEGILHIQHLRTNTDTTIQLWAASCNVLIDDMASWPASGQLDLSGFTYRNLEYPGDTKARLDWIRKQLPAQKALRRGSFRAQPYRQLAYVLRNQGLEAEALDILIGMAQDRRKYARLDWWAWFWSLILWLVIRNGYRPLRAIGWLIALWFANALIFGHGYNAGLMGPTDEKAFGSFVAESGRVPDWYPPFSSRIYAVDISLPIVSLGQREKWQPLAKSVDPKSKSPAWLSEAVRVWRWIAIVAGWFLASMLVVGVTGLVAKE